MKYYNRTNTCDRCIEKGRETKLVSGKVYREYNKEGNWTGKWLCKKCYKHYYYEKRDIKKDYTDKELLNELRLFEKDEGRSPTEKDFINNPGYPSYRTYQRRFGSWANALKMVGLDVESMIKKGVLITCQQKARLAEIIVRDHFKKSPVDLAGENYRSPCDGICPNGKTYDVKSSKFYIDKERYSFYTNNKYREEIEIYYFLAFNEDYTELDYAWRIPGEIAEKDHFYVGLSPSCEFNVEDMEQYDITNKVKYLLNSS